MTLPNKKTSVNKRLYIATVREQFDQIHWTNMLLCVCKTISVPLSFSLALVCVCFFSSLFWCALFVGSLNSHTQRNCLLSDFLLTQVDSHWVLYFLYKIKWCKHTLTYSVPVFKERKKSDSFMYNSIENTHNSAIAIWTDRSYIENHSINMKCTTS